MVQLNRTHLFSHFKFTKQIFSIFHIYACLFGKISSELCKFRAIRPTILQNMQNLHNVFMFTMPAPAENSLKFQRIKQNSLHSLTYSVKDAKFASFIYPFTLCFRCLPRQRTLGNSSKSSKIRSIRPQIL